MDCVTETLQSAKSSGNHVNRTRVFIHSVCSRARKERRKKRARLFNDPDSVLFIGKKKQQCDVEMPAVLDEMADIMNE